MKRLDAACAEPPSHRIERHGAQRPLRPRFFGGITARLALPR